MEIKKIKILIVDDHKMVRDGIRMMLESEHKHYNYIISEAETGEEAIEKIILNDFDIILMDYQLPKLNGVETIKQMLIYKSTLKILAISNYDEYIYIKNIMNAGAQGYVLKNIIPTELTVAINTILSGKKYYANDVANTLLETASDSKTKSKIKAKNINDLGITNRELQILQMVVNQMTNLQIAKRLKITKRTVDTHRQNLINKLRVKNTAGLVKYAYELKLI